MNDLVELFQRLITRGARRTEADIQADIRQFLLTAPFQLENDDLRDASLETPVGDRRRIDIEAGSTVIEVKRDLRREKVKREAEEQLAGYVEVRMAQTDLRYVGLLTDGTEWCAYDLLAGQLRQVSKLSFDEAAPDLNRLVVWLEGVLATAQDIAPTAQNIEDRLGAASSSYKLDFATLASLYEQNRDSPTVRVKRMLWSKLLTSALGTVFEDTDELFVNHTLLINTSEIIAHAVLGLPPHEIPPATLLAGNRFDAAGVHGVVESDFFDWVVEVPHGESFIHTLARRLARFTWASVEQDVLKVLYENFIGTETRKRMGEYYTPDWLADAVVSTAVTTPLTTRVLDPSCGSGTFLFHAIRSYMRAAEAAELSVSDALTGVTRHIIGMDLHPVAVTLARVTYILAIGRERLTDPQRGPIHIPVYLGDSMQWREQNQNLFSRGNLIVETSDRRELFETTLSFPDAVLENAALFDELVNELAERASRRSANSAPPSLRGVFSRLAIGEEHHATIQATFRTMCRLHDEGRNHIWGYYVRNLARPLWLSRAGNQVDVLIGNPPWLAFSHMSTEMQLEFRALSERRNLWEGAALAPHHDLSALFVVRVCELYLRRGGRFAFVLPNAALDREHYSGFRTGSYGGATGILNVTFTPSWDLRRIRPHFFPRAASVVFGSRAQYAEGVSSEDNPENREMTNQVEIWTGRLQEANASWAIASEWLVRAPGTVRRVRQGVRSPYAPFFTQGAILVPRMAFLVELQPATALGLPRGMTAVISSRSVNEKKPWKTLPSISGVIESEFVRPLLNGDNLLQFRLGSASLAVVPCTRARLLDQQEIEDQPGLNEWWRQAVAVWDANRASEARSLTESLDYHQKLSKQLPIPNLRIVYNRSGMHVCAAKVRDARALVSNGLYWSAMRSEEEADYLCAILNAPITTELTRPLMSYGKDERDIHKHIWELPIPQFDPADATHQRIAQLGAVCEKLVSEYPVDQNLHFAATRRRIRNLLADSEPGREAADLVLELIG